MTEDFDNLSADGQMLYRSTSNNNSSRTNRQLLLKRVAHCGPFTGHYLLPGLLSIVNNMEGIRLLMPCLSTKGNCERGDMGWEYRQAFIGDVVRNNSDGKFSSIDDPSCESACICTWAKTVPFTFSSE